MNRETSFNQTIGDVNNAFSIDISSTDDEKATSGEELTTHKKRLVYCGDGVVEESDEEDEEEAKRQEEDEKQKALELRKKMDLEAKNMSWVPWMGYMVQRSASRALEACDYAGEKLAWWFGITSPKFMYEIEEYNKMKEEEKRRNMDDLAEEIIIGEKVKGANETADQKISTVESGTTL